MHLSDRRVCGLLLPVFSLPGPYGIGTMGRHARLFIDFLARSGQRFWQILPLVPPGEGASPYMSCSAFAGNPLLIDPEELYREGLLTPDELERARCPSRDRVDYSALLPARLDLLRTAWTRTKDTEPAPDMPWLEEYASFSALRDRLGAPFWTWPKDARPREEDVSFHRFVQTVFYRQWFALKEYANRSGISILGDLPIYVSPDSVEMRVLPHLFQLNSRGRPAAVAGVPPDAFSHTGQLWGNPLYNWAGQPDALFRWWKERLGWAGRLYDAVRIDHFRAFHTYWSVPAGAETALEGHWEPGPGLSFLRRLEQELPGLRCVAEDLGDLDADTLEFLRDCAYPGMKVLVYAFDPNGESTYLPHNCPPDSVVYTGTHDTPTFVQWLFEEASPATRAFACDYLTLREEEGFGWGAVRGAWSSPARLAIAPLQDVLCLGGDARLNTPGTVGTHNWSWRVREEALNEEVARRLYRLTRTYRRC